MLWDQGPLGTGAGQGSQQDDRGRPSPLHARWRADEGRVGDVPAEAAPRRAAGTVDAEEGRRRFRQARRGRSAGRAMRHQRHDRSQHGRDRRRRGRLAFQSQGNRKDRPCQAQGQASARRRSSRLSSRRWSMRSRPAMTGSTSINMTATGCWFRPRAGRRPPGPGTATTGATSSVPIVRAAAKLPAGCLIDGEAVALDKKGKPSFQLLQATLKGGDARPRLLCLRPAGRPGRGHHRPPQHRAQGAACRAAQGRQPADPLWRPCHRQGREAVRRHLQGGRRGHHLEEGQGELRRQAVEELAEDQMHPAAGIRHRRLAGQRQAQGLPLAPPRRAGRAQAQICRQGRHRLRYQDDPRPQRSHAADGGRRTGAGRAAVCAARFALDRAEAGRRGRVHGIHQGCYASPPELHRAARGQAGEGGGAGEAEETLNALPDRRSRTPASSDNFGIKISNPDRVIYPGRRADQGRPRRLLCRDRSR